MKTRNVEQTAPSLFGTPDYGAPTNYSPSTIIQAYMSCFSSTKACSNKVDYDGDDQADFFFLRMSCGALTSMGDVAAK